MSVAVRVVPALRFLLPPADRTGGVRQVTAGPDATAGHLVQAAGVPLTEAGALTRDGSPAALTDRVPDGGVLDVAEVPRPQALPPGGLLLDVGLGSLARRLRLLGVDTAWSADADDPDLVVQANAEQRVLLTQDRGLLMRRALRTGALVRGSGAAAQLDDVLDRFAPSLAPLTRCTACNGALEPVTRAEVAGRLEPGTLRTAREFARCTACGRVYWRGAHAGRIDALVAAAQARLRAAPERLA